MGWRWGAAGVIRLALPLDRRRAAQKGAAYLRSGGAAKRQRRVVCSKLQNL